MKSSLAELNIIINIPVLWLPQFNFFKILAWRDILYYEMMHIKRLTRNLNSLCCTGKISRISCRGKKHSCENETNISFVGWQMGGCEKGTLWCMFFCTFSYWNQLLYYLCKNIMKIKLKKRNKVQFNLAGVFLVPDRCSL